MQLLFPRVGSEAKRSRVSDTWAAEGNKSMFNDAGLTPATLLTGNKNILRVWDGELKLNLFNAAIWSDDEKEVLL